MPWPAPLRWGLLPKPARSPWRPPRNTHTALELAPGAQLLNENDSSTRLGPLIYALPPQTKLADPQCVAIDLFLKSISRLLRLDDDGAAATLRGHAHSSSTQMTTHSAYPGWVWWVKPDPPARIFLRGPRSAPMEPLDYRSVMILKCPPISLRSRPRIHSGHRSLLNAWSVRPLLPMISKGRVYESTRIALILSLPNFVQKIFIQLVILHTIIYYFVRFRPSREILLLRRIHFSPLHWGHPLLIKVSWRLMSLGLLRRWLRQSTKRRLVLRPMFLLKA